MSLIVLQVISIVGILVGGLLVLLAPAPVSFVTALALFGFLIGLWISKIKYPTIKPLEFMNQSKTTFFLTAMAVLFFFVAFLLLNIFSGDNRPTYLAPFALGLFASFLTTIAYYLADAPTTFKTAGLLFCIMLGVIFATV